MSSSRFLVEAFVIVASILLAFAIDAGWDRLQEDEEAQEILTSLEEEFEGYVARFDWNVRSGEVALQRLETLLRAGPPSYESPPVAAVDSAIAVLLSAATSDQGGGLAALLSSGRLELLRDEALRTLLAAWPAVMSDIRDNELSTRDWSNNVVSPFMIGRGVPLARSYGTSRSGWPTGAVSDEEAQPVYDQLFRDPGFAALVSQAYSFRRNHVAESREAAADAREILEAIRANQMGDRRVGG